MVAREEAALRRLFARLLPLSLAVPLTTIACSRSTPHGSDAGIVEGDAHDAAVKDPCLPELERVILPSPSAGGVCDAYQLLRCGLPPSVQPPDGGCHISFSDCNELCPSYGAFTCRVADASCPAGRLATPGSVTVVCDFCGGNLGRRPRGFVPPTELGSANAIGAFLAAAAHLEAASVPAFEDLRDALETLGAPSELAHRAGSAARDEVRHARVTARLAGRHGATGTRLRVRRSPIVPNLEELATENAVEGCVRETYGALVASFQSHHAHDAEIARAMRPISKDETRHAALAWAIHRWVMPLLSRSARTRLATTFQEAVRELTEEIREPDGDLVHRLGIPDAGEQRRLVSGLTRALWSNAATAA